MKEKKKSTKKKLADDFKEELSIQKADESVSEETEESVNDKSIIPDKKIDEGDLKEHGDQTSSESNSAEKAEGEVLIETTLPDEKLDIAAEQKGGDKLKKQEDQKDSESETETEINKISCSVVGYLFSRESVLSST